MTEPPTFEVEFQPIGIRVEVPGGTSLFDAARQAGIELSSACGGEGKCGLCQVDLIEGRAGPLTPEERFLFSEPELKAGRRLACRASTTGDLRVHIPRQSLVTGQRLQLAANLRSIEVDPIVRAIRVILSPPTLDDIRSDLTRVADAVAASDGIRNLRATPSVTRTVPDLLRMHAWQVTAFVRGDELVGLAAPDTRPVGLAVDLGTTKIAAYLVDLETGEDLASAGAPNPQISYGEDVISRLNHVFRKPRQAAALAEKAGDAIDQLLRTMLDETGLAADQVVDGCVVGNTAMIHVLLQYPIHYLVKAPFAAVSSEPVNIDASALGLHLAPGAFVHIPPSIGGFVGADHVAMTLATEIDQRAGIVLGVDIGTNTEIMLHRPDRASLTATSCASGPAFEGAHISDGMRAASGAIEKVRITDDEVHLVTIDHAPAVGLCGSGIVDAIAQLYDQRIINFRGRLQHDRTGVRIGDHEPEFCLVPASLSGIGRDITVTQHDIDEIQLAKGAIHAGVDALLERTGTDPGEVEEVVIAGAFGSFLNVESALDIGLFPPLPNARYRQVGNAAVVGAKWMLVSATARRRGLEIAQRCHYLELTTDPGFNRKFAYGMLFPNESAKEPR